MKQFLAGVLLCSIITACGDATGPAIDLSGAWQSRSTATSKPVGISCTATATVGVRQMDTRNFGGQAVVHQVCTDASGKVTTSDVLDEITYGQIVGQGVLIQTTAGCQYLGEAYGSPVSAIVGRVDCNVTIGGTKYLFSGPWEATR